jgi:hypothetical protein
MKDCPMPRFISHSSRRLVAVLALATTAAVPSLVIIAGQTPASAGVKAKVVTTTVATVSTNGTKMH